MQESKKEIKRERVDLVGKKAYMPIDERASSGSAMPMMGDASFMSKHSSALNMMMPKKAKDSSNKMKKDGSMAMNLMEKGKAVSSTKGSSNYMNNDSALYASEKVMNTFDKDGDGKPFEKEDLKALRSKKK